MPVGYVAADSPGGSAVVSRQIIWETRCSREHSSPLPIGFELKGVEPLEDGSLWLRCDVQGPVEQG